MKTAIAKTATNALGAAEKRQLAVAAKKAEYRMKWQQRYREYREQCEVERLKKAIEIIEARMGRQQTIPDDVLERIFELVSSGETLLQSAAAFGISRSQVVRRCNETPELRARLASAREENAYAKVDGSYEIARTEPDVERARLLSDIVRWEVSKVLPQVYGDRLKVDMPDGVVFTMNIGQVPEHKEEKVIEHTE